MPNQSTQRGVTLIELLISLAVLAILVSASLPAFSGLRQNSRMSNSVNALVHSFHMARQISRAKGIDVAVCGSAGANCDDTGSWADGWLVFENTDADNPPKIDAGETLLAVHESDKMLRLSSNRPAFVLRPFGRRSTNGTFTLCSPRAPDTARSIVISYTGKPRVTPVTANPSGCGPDD